MLAFTCFMCGCNLSTRISDAVDAELDRRDEEAGEGYPVPVIYLPCEPCEAELAAYLDSDKDTPHT